MLLFKGLRKSQKLSRIIQLLITVAFIAGLANLWFTSMNQGQQLLKHQSQKMARLLVKQTAYGATPALKIKDLEQLQWLASTLVKDPKVVAATIYDNNGIRVGFAQDITKEKIDPEANKLIKLLSPYPPYVEAVMQNGDNLGFVEVRIDTNSFFSKIKQQNQNNINVQHYIIMGAGIIGMLLGRLFSYKRIQSELRTSRIKSRRKRLKKQKKALRKARLSEKEDSSNNEDVKPKVVKTKKSTTDKLPSEELTKDKVVQKAANIKTDSNKAKNKENSSKK